MTRILVGRGKGTGVIPGFVINGKLKAGSRLPSAAEIERWIKEEKTANT